MLTQSPCFNAFGTWVYGLRCKFKTGSFFDMNDLLWNSGVRVVFDQCGRPRTKEGLLQPGFQTLLQWAQSGRACIKLSGIAKFSQQFPFCADAQPYAKALIEAFTPQSLVWASDWPFCAPPRAWTTGPFGVKSSIGFPMQQTAKLCFRTHQGVYLDGMLKT